MDVDFPFVGSDKSRSFLDMIPQRAPQKTGAVKFACDARKKQLYLSSPSCLSLQDHLRTEANNLIVYKTYGKHPVRCFLGQKSTQKRNDPVV